MVDERLWRWVVAIILGGFVVAAWYGRQRGLFWGGDDADYLLLARGLRELRYEDAFLVAAPPHTKYPPVYPALLSFWGLLFGDGVGAAATLSVLLVAGTLAIATRLVRTHASAPAAAALLLVMAANPYVLEYAGRVLSEAPMMFFAACAVYLADRETGPGVAGAIASAVLCALTRSAGVAVIAGLGAHWLLGRRWKHVAFLALTAAIALGGWVAWVLQSGPAASGSYVSEFGTYLPRDDENTVVGNFVTVLRGKLASLFSSHLPEALGFPLTGASRLDNLLFAPLAAAGVAVGLWRLRGRARAVVLVSLAYLGLLLIWPWRGVRLLVPILPALIVTHLTGLAALVARWRATAARPAVLGFVALLVLAGAWQAGPILSCDGSIFSRTPECVRDQELGLAGAIAFLRDSVDSKAVVMIRRGEVSYYYSGHKTVPWPQAPQSRGAPVDSVLAHSGADYLLAAEAYGVRGRHVAVFLERACDRLSVDFAARPHTALLRVHPVSDPPSEDACDLVRRDFGPSSPGPEGEQAGASEAGAETSA